MQSAAACPPGHAALFRLGEFLPRNFHNYAANPIVNVAAYPLDGLPVMLASSELRLSAKIPSRMFVVGFEPASGNAICVTLSDEIAELPVVVHDQDRPRHARQIVPEKGRRCCEERESACEEFVKTP